MFLLLLPALCIKVHHSVSFPDERTEKFSGERPQLRGAVCMCSVIHVRRRTWSRSLSEESQVRGLSLIGGGVLSNRVLLLAVARMRLDWKGLR